MGVPPKKRARRDSTSSLTSKAEAAELPQFDQHPQLWFEDGNIIFIAGTSGFKLHHSVAPRESAVLRDRCGGEGAEMVYDGLPSFILNEDRFDAAAMFRRVYGDLREADVPQYTFVTISAFLRMGKTYQISRLYKEAESVLISCYPRTLEQFDIVLKMESSQRRMKISQSQSYDVVKLAHQMGLDAILPAALYRPVKFRRSLYSNFEAPSTSPTALATIIGFSSTSFSAAQSLRKLRRRGISASSTENSVLHVPQLAPVQQVF